MNQSDDKTRVLLLGGIGFLIVLIVLGLIWAVMSGPSASPTASNTANGTVRNDVRFSDDGDPAVGPGESKSVVRIFGDLECPACKAAEPGLQDAIKNYSDRVRFVWNDFPLTSVHPNAQPAAIAARCAEDQGKFWEYRTMLYDNQSAWADQSAPTQTFVSYASSLGLDTSSFTACLASKPDLRKIQDDMAEGNANGVNGTPTFFLGNTEYVGGMSSQDWTTALDALLKESGS